MAFTLAKKVTIESIFASVVNSNENKRTSPSTTGSPPPKNASNWNDSKIRTSSLSTAGKSAVPIIAGPHMLLSSNTSGIDYYLLAGSRLLAHNKINATIAVVDAASLVQSSSLLGQSSNSQPLLLQTNGEAIDQVLVLSSSVIAILSSSVTFQSTTSEGKSRSNYSSPQESQDDYSPQAIKRTKKRSTSRDNSSVRTPSKSKVKELGPKQKSKSRLDEELKTPTKSDKKDPSKLRSSDKKESKRDKRKSHDGNSLATARSGAIAEVGVSESPPPGKQYSSSPVASPILLSKHTEIDESRSSPTHHRHSLSESDGSPSSRRNKVIHLDSSNENDLAKIPEDGISGQNSSSKAQNESSPISPIFNTSSNSSPTMRTITESGAISFSDSKSQSSPRLPFFEPPADSVSTSPASHSSPTVSPKQSSKSPHFSKQPVATDSLRSSYGSSGIGAYSKSYGALSTRNQWIQIFHFDPSSKVPTSSTIVTPETCEGMRGVKKLMVGIEDSLLIESEEGVLYDLLSGSNLPVQISIPEDVTTKGCHIQTIGGSYLVLMKNSAAQFTLCTLERTGVPADAIFVDIKRKPKRTSKFAILDHLRPSKFMNLGTVTPVPAENQTTLVLKPLLRGHSPDGASFLKVEIQADLLIALTAICIMTWELNAKSVGKSSTFTVSSSTGSLSPSPSPPSNQFQQIRIPLSSPVFSFVATKDRLMTGDIDGAIIVYERSTGRRRYNVNSVDTRTPEPSQPAINTSSGNTLSGSTSNISMSGSGNVFAGNGNTSPIPGTNSPGLSMEGPNRKRSSSNIPKRYSVTDKVHSRINQLFVFHNFYVVARFESGECSVWTLSPNQLEPVQRLVRVPTADSSGKAGMTTTSFNNTEDGLLCMDYQRGTQRKIRIYRCRAPPTTFVHGATIPVDDFSMDRTGLNKDQLTTRGFADYVEEIHKLAPTIYEQYPWLCHISQAVCVADNSLPHLPLIYMNKAFTELTQYPPEEVLGLNCKFLQGKYTDLDSPRNLKMALERGEFVEIPYLLNYRKDGSHFFNNLSIFPIHNKKKKVIAFVGILRDVSTSRCTKGLRHVVDWTDVEVAMWLDSIKFGQYGFVFLHQQVDGAALLCANETFLLNVGVVRDDVESLLSEIAELKADIFRRKTSFRDLLEWKSGFFGDSSSPDLSISQDQEDSETLVPSTSSSYMFLVAPSAAAHTSTNHQSSTINSCKIPAGANHQGTLIKLTYLDQSAMILCGKKELAFPWSTLQMHIEFRFSLSQRTEVTYYDEIRDSNLLVTEANWCHVLLQNLNGIIRLDVTVKHHIPAQNGINSLGADFIAPMITSSMSMPLALAPISLSQPSPIQSSKSQHLIIDESQTTWNPSNPASSIDSIPASPSMSPPPITNDDILSSNIPPSSSISNNSVVGGRSIDDHDDRSESSSSQASATILKQTVLSLPSLATSVGTLGSFFGESAGTSVKKSFARFIEKTNGFSPEAAKVMERLFKKIEEDYPWLMNSTNSSGGLAIVENNPFHTIVFVNTEMEKMTLYPKSSLIGSNYNLLMGKETDATSRALFTFPPSSLPLTQTKSPLMDVEVVLYGADGMPFVTSVIAYPIFKDGRPSSGSVSSSSSSREMLVPTVTHFLLLNRDVTSLRLQEIPPALWSPVEVCCWIAGSEFSELASFIFELGIDGSDLICASENPTTIEWITNKLEIRSSHQRIDFADMLIKLRNHQTFGSAQPSARQSTVINKTDEVANLDNAEAPLIISNSLSTPQSSSIPLATLTPASPKLKPQPAQVHFTITPSKREERTVVKFYHGSKPLIVPLHPFKTYTVSDLIHAAKSVGVSEDCQIRVHSQETSRTSKIGALLDDDLWKKIYLERKSKTIRFDVISFFETGVPKDVTVPALFNDMTIPPARHFSFSK